MKRIFIFLLMLIMATSAFAADEVVYITDTDITQKLITEGSAEYNPEDNSILLCPKITWQSGKAKYPFEVLEDFSLKFEYKIGGGTSADGIMLAFFAEKDSVVKDGGYLNFDGCGGYGLEFDTYCNINDSRNAHIAIVRDEVSNHLIMVDEPRVDDEKWHLAEFEVKGNKATLLIDGDTVIDTEIEFDKTYRYIYFSASTGASTDDHYIRNVCFTGRAAYSNASEWAINEMDKAEQYNLIPAVLKGADMTRQITRREFAALSVSLYEACTNKTAEPVETPFTDTEDAEVAKAYGLGITNGISPTEFAEDMLITREQVATMLTRTMKSIDSSLQITYSSVVPFADDEYISDWAKDSVYFMYANGIINGIGDNKFAPRNTNTAEETIMYANSTREQALAMSVRAYENMKK